MYYLNIILFVHIIGAVVNFSLAIYRLGWSKDKKAIILRKKITNHYYGSFIIFLTMIVLLVLSLITSWLGIEISKNKGN